MGGDAPILHPPEWPVVRLGDIALKIGSGATPPDFEPVLPLLQEISIEIISIMKDRYDPMFIFFGANIFNTFNQNAVIEKRLIPD